VETDEVRPTSPAKGNCPTEFPHTQTGRDGKALTVSIHRTLSANGNEFFFVIESSQLKPLQANVFTFN
jgi:hypothetical protein